MPPIGGLQLDLDQIAAKKMTHPFDSAAKIVRIAHHILGEDYLVMLKRVFVLACLSVSALGLAACEPEVGSEEWCQDMKEKNKGDWTANEATEFAKSCLF